MHVVVHTDGGSRGNPGPAASAFTIHSPQNEIIASEKKYIGITTNNVAEYSALLMSLEYLETHAKDLGVAAVDVLMDSELVVKQMNGLYKIKDENLKALAFRAKSLENSISVPVHYVYIPRAKNAEADRLVNEALDLELTHQSSTGN